MKRLLAFWVCLMAAFGVESNLEHDDYLKGLQSLRKVW